MIFIIGGAYQGKLDFAKEKYNLLDEDIFICDKTKDIDISKKCFYHFEEYLFYCFKNNVECITNFNNDTIIIMNEIFSGVVPIDEEIRSFREYAGRKACEITKNSSEIIRLFCGIPQKLK